MNRSQFEQLRAKMIEDTERDLGRRLGYVAVESPLAARRRGKPLRLPMAELADANASVEIATHRPPNWRSRLRVGRFVRRILVRTFGSLIVDA